MDILDGMKLRKRRKANAVVAKIEQSVNILQEHVADDPEVCCL
jgi:hypothetical protein